MDIENVSLEIYQSTTTPAGLILRLYDRHAIQHTRPHTDTHLEIPVLSPKHTFNRTMFFFLTPAGDQNRQWLLILKIVIWCLKVSHPSLI